MHHAGTEKTQSALAVLLAEPSVHSILGSDQLRGDNDLKADLQTRSKTHPADIVHQLHGMLSVPPGSSC